MEAAESFEGDDGACGKGGGDDGEIDGKHGAAGGTGDGLGMKTAIGGIGVFARAGGAQGERPHGGVGAIVGRGHRDGVARAAVGAVGEGISEAAGGGVADFGDAFRARGEIGGDEGEAAVAGGAGEDLKIAISGWGREFFDVAAGDAGGARGFGLERLQEGLNGAIGFDFDDKSAGSVEGDAREPEAVGKPFDEGAETDSLDDAFEGDAIPREASDSDPYCIR